MGYIKVKNKRNTSKKTPPQGYTSWLSFWENKKDKKADICEALGCNNKYDLIGGHVIKSGQGAKEYILPICKTHNHLGQLEYEAWESDLVIS